MDNKMSVLDLDKEMHDLFGGKSFILKEWIGIQIKHATENSDNVDEEKKLIPIWNLEFLNLLNNYVVGKEDNDALSDLINNEISSFWPSITSGDSLEKEEAYRAYRSSLSYEFANKVGKINKSKVIVNIDQLDPYWEDRISKIKSDWQEREASFNEERKKRQIKLKHTDAPMDKNNFEVHSEIVRLLEPLTIKFCKILHRLYEFEDIPAGLRIIFEAYRKENDGPTVNYSINTFLDDEIERVKYSSYRKDNNDHEERKKR